MTPTRPVVSTVCEGLAELLAGYGILYELPQKAPRVSAPPGGKWQQENIVVATFARI